MGLLDRVSVLFRRRSSRALLPGPGPAGPGLPMVTSPPEERRPAKPKATGPGPGQGFFRGLARRYDSIVNMLSGLGGEDDKGTHGRPDTGRVPLDYQELQALYAYNGYAARYIDIVVDDATRKGWTIKDSSQASDLLSEETIRLQVKQRLTEGLKWARAYGGSVILLVVDEEPPPGFTGTPAQLLLLPLDLDRVKRVLNLVVMDPSEAQPYEYEGDPRSLQFREARTWMLSPNSGGSTSLMMAGQQVHRSRVIYLPGKRLTAQQRLQNNGFDQSVLECTWDQIRNKTSVDQAGAHLAQELKINVMKIDGLAALQTGDQADLLDMRMRVAQRSKSNLNMILVGSGEEFQTQATPFTGFDQLDKNATDALCAVFGMPATRLFGQAPGGLNTDGLSQETIWTHSIAAYQEDHVLPPLTYLYRVIFRSKEGPTRGVEPKSWKVECNPLDELTTTEQANLEKTHAETDAIRVSSGVLPPEHIAKSRFTEKGYQSEILPYDQDEAMAAEVRAFAQAQAAIGNRTAAPGAPGAAVSPASPAPPAPAQPLVSPQTTVPEG